MFSQIPEPYRKDDNYALTVFIVLEKLENQMRIWFKDRDRGFLPKDSTRNTMPVNPIEFNFNTTNSWTTEADFKRVLNRITLGLNQKDYFVLD